MIPYSRPKLSDLYALSQRKLLENHTLQSGTYLHTPKWQYPPGTQSGWAQPGLVPTHSFTKGGYVTRNGGFFCRSLNLRKRNKHVKTHVESKVN